MRAAAALIVAAGVARIVTTYAVFSQTVDEPTDVARGMEWLDNGSYVAGPAHPPLGPVAVALGIYLDGVRLSAPYRQLLDEADERLRRGDRYESPWFEETLSGEMYATGDGLLDSGGSYRRHLTLARAGVLPFFVLAAALVFAWTRRIAGGAAALAATLLFTSLPPVLAHAGLATTDMALTATATAALFAMSEWLREPTFGRTLTLGLTAGLAVLSKLSALLFLPAGAVALLVMRAAVTRRSHSEAAGDAGVPLVATALAVVTMLAVVWLGHRFSLAPLKYGIEQLAYHASNGHPSILLGELRTNGWWYFFPFVIAVKTPLAFLFLAAAGSLLLARRSWETGRWELAAPVAFAGAILLACLPSTIDVGVRHVLPVYPLLAVAAGAATAGLWRSPRLRGVGPRFASALIAWHLASSTLAHPDYLAYFNELVPVHPESILNDSDLDWGQDLGRLADALRARGITDDVMIAGWSAVDLARYGLAGARVLMPDGRTRGWVAIRVHLLKVEDGYSWLDAYAPVAWIGRSVRLYFIP
jgi:hypothetical protein